MARRPMNLKIERDGHVYRFQATAGIRGGCTLTVQIDGKGYYLPCFMDGSIELGERVVRDWPPALRVYAKDFEANARRWLDIRLEAAK